LVWAQQPLEQRVRARLERGSISLALSLEAGDKEPLPDLDLDVDLLRKLYRDLQSLRAEIAPEETLRLADLLGLEGVIRLPGEARCSAERLLHAVEAATDEALDGLQSMQEREGDHLAGELGELLRDLEARVAEIEGGLPAALAETRDRYRARIEEFLDGSGVAAEPSALVREIAILAEKADITEELSRLKGHIGQYREVVDGGGRVGRKLDFLTQEMFRESSTMAAKVSQYELARMVVEIKAVVDRLREQSQNIE
ncbi:MAG: YicC family protein, partial [Planctomycetota bacterium]